MDIKMPDGTIISNVPNNITKDELLARHEARKKFKAMLEKEEGNEESSYEDSLGKLTGGIGHLLTPQEQKQYPKGTKIPQNIRDSWFESDSKKAYTAAKEQAKNLKISDQNFIAALGSVNFQLGTSWYKEHKKTWAALEAGKYTEAAKEAANSNWHKQTPRRVKSFQAAIQSLQKTNP